jgi:hypothetical protein
MGVGRAPRTNHRNWFVQPVPIPSYLFWHIVFFFAFYHGPSWCSLLFRTCVLSIYNIIYLYTHIMLNLVFNMLFLHTDSLFLAYRPIKPPFCWRHSRQEPPRATQCCGPGRHFVPWLGSDANTQGFSNRMVFMQETWGWTIQNVELIKTRNNQDTTHWFEVTQRNYPSDMLPKRSG